MVDINFAESCPECDSLNIDFRKKYGQEGTSWYEVTCRDCRAVWEDCWDD